MNIQDLQTSSILIVEDNKTGQELLKAVFEDSGYKVITADNGDQALEILKNDNTFSVVITDIMMPKKEGVSLIRYIRSHFSNIKIVAISAVMNNETVLKTAIEFGADLTFKKPFDIIELTDSVDKLLAAIN